MWFLEGLENLNDDSLLMSEVLHEEDFININQKKRCLLVVIRILEANWVYNKTRKVFNKKITMKLQK
jgi:hypothetical protein